MYKINLIAGFIIFILTAPTYAETLVVCDNIDSTIRIDFTKGTISVSESSHHHLFGISEVLLDIDRSNFQNYSYNNVVYKNITIKRKNSLPIPSFRVNQDGNISEDFSCLVTHKSES